MMVRRIERTLIFYCSGEGRLFQIHKLKSVIGVQQDEIFSCSLDSFFFFLSHFHLHCSPTQSFLPVCEKLDLIRQRKSIARKTQHKQWPILAIETLFLLQIVLSEKSRRTSTSSCNKTKELRLPYLPGDRSTEQGSGV